MFKAALSLTIAMLVCAPAHAIDVLKLEEFRKREKEAADLYVGAVGEGIFQANVMVSVRGDRPLYCPPGKLVVTSENYVRIAWDEVERMRKEDLLDEDSTIELALLFGLIKTFPCDTK